MFLCEGGRGSVGRCVGVCRGLHLCGLCVFLFCLGWKTRGCIILLWTLKAGEQLSFLRSLHGLMLGVGDVQNTPPPPPPVSTSQISQFICDFGFILGDGTTTYSIIHIYKKTNKFDISRVVSVGNYTSPFLHLIETGYFVITEACEIPSHRARQLAGQWDQGRTTTIRN